MEFRLLGEVGAEIDGVWVDLGHARQRSVLAVLLIEANRVVHVDQLLDRVWADHRPQRAVNSLYSYLSRLRSCLAGAEGVGISRRSGGYLLTVDPAAVDLHRFRGLVAGTGAVNDDEAALRRFDEALGLWRGEPFARLDTPWLNETREALTRERRAAERDRTDVALRLGLHASLLPDLLREAPAHPLDERLAGQLMRALYRCGRQAEALDHYDRLRRVLADETGVDPGPDLQALHLGILNGEPALAAPAAATTAPHPTPRQLPAPPPLFTGRVRELATLSNLLEGQAGDAEAVAVAVIGGIGGIGKTWLALRWAYDNLDRFPDGQLYVNLRGFDPSADPVPPAVALRGFLDALAVAPRAIPTGLDAQAALYRSLIAGRRMLIVLDNAQDTAQVVPLLPGSPTCTVLVTSRRRLGGLVAQGAQGFTLNVLTDDEAHHLLSRRFGARRVAEEPDSVAALLDRCRGLPLALSIVAARAAMQRDLPLRVLVEELSEEATRLDALTTGELTADLRAVFAASTRALQPRAAGVFRLLGLTPGPDVSLGAVASLNGLPAQQTRTLLHELHEAHLVHQQTPTRYRLHDLVRLYAAEQVERDLPETGRAALRRMLDHYLHTAHAAACLLDPLREPITLPPAEHQLTLDPVADQAKALAWFHTEHAVLLSILDRAVRDGLDAYVWRLAWTLESYLDEQGHWRDWTTTQLAALRAARRLGDRRWQACSHRSLGVAHTQLGELDEAHRHHGTALTLFEDLGDLVSQAHTHRGIGWVYNQQDRWSDALHHNELALDLYRQAGHRPGQARAVNNAGWLHAQLGDHHAALAYCERAVELNQELGDRHAEAGAWDSLGYTYHHLGRHAEANACYQRALDLVRGFRDRYNEAEILTHLGASHRAAGEVDLARDFLRQAVTILRELDHPHADEVAGTLRELDRAAAR
ncbi:AfsR/SARP family transcriptional regulator [Micromonospora sp. MA102]|uniref:AfsR/SARP family transcriptional regulator n=1 Tax=Micromonospora sp. MA102 TaxID=2952755 RepID=UPI0021C7D188|nr:AfsR/SARP family transcriptional regulator [Micromonospora sp. MA102]